MAKQGGPFIFEKTFGNTSCYKRCGVGLVRCKSNLTAERWRKDPAFAGSRKSAAELGLAATIAAPFYKAIPQAIRKFSLYRQLVGLAKKLLSNGTPVAGIEETLALAVIRLHKTAPPCKQKQASLPKRKPSLSPVKTHAVTFPWQAQLSVPSIKVQLYSRKQPVQHVSRHKSSHRRTIGRSA